VRILIGLTYYRPHYSGLTIYAERQARALAERGHQVTILTSRFDPSLPAYEVYGGIEVVRLEVGLHVSKGVLMPAMPWWAWKLARRADVVNLHMPQFDASFIAAIARMQRKPVVLTYHCDLHLPSGFIHKIANRVSDLSNHIAAQLAQVIVHNTRDYAEASPFLRRYLDKVIAIYPPVEVTAITNEERDAFRKKHCIQPGERIIGMAARLATEKGVEYLAQALPLILQRFPQARVLMVGPYQHVIGEGQYAARVLDEIEPYRAHWKFLGVVSPQEMSAFFHESEVVVLPSLNSTESYGLVQIEAMSCGSPVVASNLPGVRVPVTQTGAGLIVQPASAPDLARAVIAVLEKPELYRGDTAEIIRQSTPEAVAQRYEGLYEQVIKQGAYGIEKSAPPDSKV
jgi:glycosyltransferase involved in cell wall biosynthesis